MTRTHRKKPKRKRPHLSLDQILEWVDTYHERRGRWPTNHAKLVYGVLGETWMAIDMALYHGHRGLPGGSSLARLLAQHRGVRNRAGLPLLTVEKILKWADQYHEREGQWPQSTSGTIPSSGGETWNGVSKALTKGRRGLPGGSSLANLLAAHRGVRNKRGLPSLAVAQILYWADEHHACTGQWPTCMSGPITGADGQTWAGVDIALRKGGRGLPRCPGLWQLLVKHRGKDALSHPPLKVKDILAWADAHFQRTGQWPRPDYTPIPESPRENWHAIGVALQKGCRGLRGGLTLAKLLAKHRKVPCRSCRSSLKVERILSWADKHHRRTSAWPTVKSGPVEGAPGETWLGIDAALRKGNRGLCGGTSLAGLLAVCRGVRNIQNPPLLDIRKVVKWAKRHRRRMGRWPTKDSGAVEGVGGETWMSIDCALRDGRRGMPKGSSLAQLLKSHEASKAVSRRPGKNRSGSK